MIVGITGATGIIGSIIKLKLQSIDDVYISCFKGDIRLKHDIDNWLDNNKLDYLFHFAALVPVTEVENNVIKAYDINVGGIINLLDCLLRKNQKPWIFYSSTSHVYKSSTQPLSESSEIDPITKYGFTKLIGENIFLDSIKLGFDVCIGRIFSFYHKNQIKPFLYPTIIERLENEDLTKPFLLKGANDIRDIMKAEEICDLIIKLMNKKAIGVYNIGSGRGIIIRDFVQSLSNVNLDIIPENNDISALVANINKLKNFLNE